MPYGRLAPGDNCGHLIGCCSTESADTASKFTTTYGSVFEALKLLIGVCSVVKRDLQVVENSLSRYGPMSLVTPG